MQIVNLFQQAIAKKQLIENYSNPGWQMQPILGDVL